MLHYSRLGSTCFLTPAVILCALGVAGAASRPGEAIAAGDTIAPVVTQQGSMNPAGAPMPGQYRVSGYALLMSGQYVQALRIFEAIDPKTAETYNQIGIAAEHLKMPETAEKNYKMAIQMQPHFADAYNNLGTIYYSRNNYKQAAKFYKKALHIDHRNAYAMSNLGTLYFAEKKYDKGEKAYQRAFEVNKEVFETDPASMFETTGSPQVTAELHFYLARLFAQSGLQAEAMFYLEKAVNEGFNDKSRLLKDSSFSSVRTEPQFTRIVRNMQG